MEKFIYTSALEKIRRMKARIKIIPGGTSAGKTFSILPILADKCIKEPGLSVSIVAESMPVLRRGAMRDFLKIMKSTNRYIDVNWNRSNSIYNFSNGSFIEFFGVEDESKLRGARRNVLYINECNRVSEEVYTQLAMRTDKDIYLDYNPTGRFWIEAVKESFESEVLILTYKDNEALSESVKKFLESKLILSLSSDYWLNWCKVYLYGQQGVLEGVVFNNWSIIEHIPFEAELVGYGMDFGFTNDPSTCMAVYKYDKKIIIDEILCKKGLTNSEISSILKSENVKGQIIADSAEPKSIEELRRHGHSIFPAKKGPDSINAGINMMQQQPILITKRSINLKKNLENYCWKKDENGNSINSPIDAYNDCIDAARYLFINKLGHRGVPDFGFELL